MDLLQKRYGNPQLIISSHINAPVKLRSVTKQNGVVGLRTNFNQLNSHIKSLCTLVDSCK